MLFCIRIVTARESRFIYNMSILVVLPNRLYVIVLSVLIEM